MRPINADELKELRDKYIRGKINLMGMNMINIKILGVKKMVSL